MVSLAFSGDAPFGIAFWLAFCLWFAFEGIAWKRRLSADSTRGRDRGSLALLSILGWTGVLMDFALSHWLPAAAIPWARSEIFVLGIGLMLGGIWLRWYAMALLGRYFTYDVAVQSGQTVIESGPYRYVRHPAYSGALLTFLGFGLALGNWGGLAALLVCVGIAYTYRIAVEEEALVAAIGEPYARYMLRTCRLIPFLF